MNWIDGNAIATRQQEETAASVAHFQKTYGFMPGLATVLVGEDPASETYVRSKRRTSEALGIRSFAHTLPADTSQDDLIALLDQLNANPEVHGILVQLPLPSHLDEKMVLDRIAIEKDVDGLHPMNIGLLAMKDREPFCVPCTPQGIMVMLDSIGFNPAGKRAVVLGRSNIVGIPMALLLNNANATVTIAHSRTPDLPALCRQADLLVAAVGRSEMVQADWIQKGAVVIDVGINRVDDPSRKRGYRLVGDVHTETVAEVASAITPVPGGVGPMTIAMLMQNTLRAAQRAAAR